MESVHLQLPADLLARVDEAAGDVPRNRWIRRALERELTDPRLGDLTSAYDQPEVEAVGLQESQIQKEISDDHTWSYVKRDVQPRPKGKR